jgi:hypothetical protein
MAITPVLIFLILAFVCFCLAAASVPAKLDWMALGLLLWVVAGMFGAGGIVLVLLILAGICFAIAAFHLMVFEKSTINWIAIGLALWVLAAIFGSIR